MTLNLERHLATAYWHLIAHRAELAAPGDYLRLDWPLGELVLFNDEGNIVAFDNICPHRGARLFVEDCGSGRAICPYHGWSLRGGKVRPARAELFEPAVLAGARLNAYRTQWCGDFLFVGVEPQAALDAQLGEMTATLEAISRQIAGRRDFNAFSFESSWRVAVENALESYHVASVHGATLASFAMTDEQDAFIGPNCSYQARIGAGRTERGLKALKRFFDIDFQVEGYLALHVFPFAMISSTFGYSYSLQTFLPSREAGRTHFASRLLASRTAPGCEPVAQPLFDSAAKMNRQIFEEDHAICRRVSPLYDLDAPDRIFGANEERAKRFWLTLRRINETQGAAAPSARPPLRVASGANS